MSNALYMLIAVAAAVVLFAWLIQGVLLYRSSRGDIYNDIYGSFPAYFYRYVILRNCSESGYLRSRIGFNRIVFSTITGDDGAKSRFAVIFYDRGIFIICYVKVTGRLSAKADSKYLSIMREDKEGVRHTYRHLNPSKDLEAYSRRIADTFPGVHLEERLAFPDKADIGSLRLRFKAIHFSEIDTELSRVEAAHLSDEDIKNMHQKLIKG